MISMSRAPHFEHILRLKNLKIPLQVETRSIHVVSIHVQSSGIRWCPAQMCGASIQFRAFFTLNMNSMIHSIHMVLILRMVYDIEISTLVNYP